MIELLRAEVEEAGLRRGVARRIERLALREVLPRRALLGALVSLLGLAQRLGLDRLLLPLLPEALRDAHASLPRVPARHERTRAPARTPARGAPRGSVAFFEGCVMPELFGPVNAATVRVLARNGFEVRSPAGQGCCGALHAHAGDDAFARDLARRNVAAFGAEPVDAVVVNSAGCGAAMRDAAEWLPNEGERFAASVRDVCEWLDEKGLAAPLGAIDARVCYDDPCHLVHAQRVQEAPRRLLAAIPGLTLVAHDDPGACCGAAGIYGLTHREMSQAVLARKLDALEAADPDIIATGNPGCLMQLRAGAAARGLRARVVHPIELIDEAQRRAP